MIFHVISLMMFVVCTVISPLYGFVGVIAPQYRKLGPSESKLSRSPPKWMFKGSPRMFTPPKRFNMAVAESCIYIYLLIYDYVYMYVYICRF